MGRYPIFDAEAIRIDLSVRGLESSGRRLAAPASPSSTGESEVHLGLQPADNARDALARAAGEIPSLVEVARRGDTVLLAIRAAAPDLVELTMRPALAATARFGLVTLRRRIVPPGTAAVRALMAQLLIAGPA
jgi:hypothetical protein